MSTTICRSAYRVLVAASMTALALGAWQYFDAQRPAAIVVEKPSRVFDALPCGTTQEVTFPVQNNASFSVRIFGVEKLSCGKNCCLTLEFPEPIDLPPGTQFAIRCSLKVNGPGEFYDHLVFFVEEAGEYSEITLEVRGTGVAVPPKTNGNFHVVDREPTTQ